MCTLLLKATENALLDPLMREACLATSAAPTFLPAVNFQTTDASGNTLEYNCVDGTLVNNNPVSSMILLSGKLTIN